MEREQQQMMEANEVFKCSGTLEHMHNCDGNCGTEELSELDVLLNQERQRWVELDMLPMGKPPQIPVHGIPVETHHLEVSVATLVDFLAETGVIDKEALNVKFKQYMLERLTRIREANQDAIIEARRRQGIAVAGADVLPKLEVPGYIKRGMN